jgi:murein DD-endopeptidase MepM/ murein hydrolase activator NlpD
MVKEEVITKTVDKIVVYGAKNVVYYGTKTYFAWPTTKPFRISSGYGYRSHPIRGEYHFHPAIDITGTPNKEIYAIQDGIVTKVVQTGYNSGSGTYITIDHGDGYVASYLHLKKNSIIVKKGETVQKGQKIATMGTTGSSTGVHLDFRIKKNGEYINPMKLYK